MVSIGHTPSQIPVRRSSHPSAHGTVDSIVKDIQTFALVCAHVSFALDVLGKKRNGDDTKSKILTLSKVLPSPNETPR